MPDILLNEELMGLAIKLKELPTEDIHSHSDFNDDLLFSMVEIFEEVTDELLTELQAHYLDYDLELVHRDMINFELLCRNLLDVNVK